MTTSVSVPCLLQVAESTYPPAPAYRDMFNWPFMNAETLMNDDSLRKSFAELLRGTSSIVLHEDYAGTGNCGTSLVQQFRALKSVMLSKPELSEFLDGTFAIPQVSFILLVSFSGSDFEIQRPSQPATQSSPAILRRCSHARCCHCHCL